MVEAEAVAVKSLSTSGGISDVVDAGERARVPGDALDEAGDGPWLEAEDAWWPFVGAFADDALDESGVGRSFVRRLSLERSIVEIQYWVRASTR